MRMPARCIAHRPRSSRSSLLVDASRSTKPQTRRRARHVRCASPSAARRKDGPHRASSSTSRTCRARRRSRRHATIRQREKQFDPPLTVVVKGTTVDFPNEDKIFHNVFSVSRPARFDLGLYKSGTDEVRRDEARRHRRRVLQHSPRHDREGEGPRQRATTRSPARPARSRSRACPPGEYPIVAWLPTGDEAKGNGHGRGGRDRRRRSSSVDEVAKKDDAHPEGRHAIRSLQVALVVAGGRGGACGAQRRRGRPTPSARVRGRDRPRRSRVGRWPATVDARRGRARCSSPARARCGECHEKMYDEWEVSAHAKAATLAALQGRAPRAPTTRRAIAATRRSSPRAAPTSVAPEGVTCDVCHTLREPAPIDERRRASALAIDDMVKYGPRCDLKDHYFHRMGCSPEHAKAELCGACHWWEPNGMPVFTEYEDWQRRPGRAGGLAVPGLPHAGREGAALAVGSPVRDGVPHHGLLGVAAICARHAAGPRRDAAHADGWRRWSRGDRELRGPRPCRRGCPSAGAARGRVRPRRQGAGAVDELRTGGVLVDVRGAPTRSGAVRVGSDTAHRAGQAVRHRTLSGGRPPARSWSRRVRRGVRAVSAVAIRCWRVAGAARQADRRRAGRHGKTGAKQAP